MPTRNQQNTTRKGGARGFASMDADKQRAIASAGGRAAHRSGNAHEFDTEEAREAGRRGGLARSRSAQPSRSAASSESPSGERRASQAHGPGRDDGRSGRKGQGSMRTSDIPRTDASDDNTRTGRGKHH